MKITATTTFDDIRQALIKQDPDLEIEIKGLNDANKKMDFHFFMALVLGGTDHNNDAAANFVKIIYDQPNNDGFSSWNQNVGRFVDPSSKSFPKQLDEKLQDIPGTTQLQDILNGKWYNLPDKNGNPIFGTNSINFVRGDKRAKYTMIQMANAMIHYVPTGTSSVVATPGKPMSNICTTLLESNKQLIMNGAPGTGKTYSARNGIADELLGLTSLTDKQREYEKKIRMEMVQFHPSYDYTDFIEGIRPTMSASSIGYTLKNGTFKSFCRRAGVIERIIAAGKTIDAATINAFLKGENQDIINYWNNWYNNDYKKYLSVLSAKQREESEEGKEEPEDTKDLDIIKNLPRFLFIIDEINRAEISKVLGETMYCLDADYRGPKGMIATQYSSMATDESFFVNKDDDKFFIPSNVYIIGTMNDIDRSVEVFDFAMRRRFAWYEVKAEDVMDEVLTAMQIDVDLGNDYEDYQIRISDVNTAIENDLKLNRHYHLGPSYFAKIGLYLQNNNYQAARKKVWDNHISQILYEYVKGKRTEEKIEDIKENFES